MVGSVRAAPGTTAFGVIGTGDATGAGETSGTSAGEVAAAGGGTIAPVPGRMSCEVLLPAGAGGAAAAGGSTSGVRTAGANGAVTLASGVGPGAGAGATGAEVLPSGAGVGGASAWGGATTPSLLLVAGREMAGRLDALTIAGKMASGETTEPLRTTAGSMRVALPRPPTGVPAVAFITLGVSTKEVLRPTGLVALVAAGVRGATPLHAVPLPAVPLLQGESASAMVTETQVLVAALQVVPFPQTQMLFSSTAPAGHGTHAVPLKIKPSVQLESGFRMFKGVVAAPTFSADALPPPPLLVPVCGRRLAAPAAPAVPVRKRYAPRFSVHPRPMTRLSRKPGCVERPGMPPAEPSSEGEPWFGSVLGFW